MQTAQDKYKELLRDHLGPQLRQLGYRGSGNTWRLVDSKSGNQAVLIFQSSRWNNKQEVEFTLNVAVYNAQFWDWRNEIYALDDRPAPKPGLGFEAFAVYSSRSGHLLPEIKQDYWWQLTSNTDIAQLAQQIYTGIAQHISPPLVSILSNEAQVEFLVDQMKRHPEPSKVWNMIALSVILPPDHSFRSELAFMLRKIAAKDPRPIWLPLHAEAFSQQKPWPIDEYRRLTSEEIARIRSSL